MRRRTVSLAPTPSAPTTRTSTRAPRRTRGRADEVGRRHVDAACVRAERCQVNACSTRARGCMKARLCSTVAMRTARMAHDKHAARTARTPWVYDVQWPYWLPCTPAYATSCESSPIACTHGIRTRTHTATATCPALHKCIFRDVTRVLCDRGAAPAGANSTTARSVGAHWPMHRARCVRGGRTSGVLFRAQHDTGEVRVQDLRSALVEEG